MSVSSGIPGLKMMMAPLAFELRACENIWKSSRREEVVKTKSSVSVKRTKSLADQYAQCGSPFLYSQHCVWTNFEVSECVLGDLIWSHDGQPIFISLVTAFLIPEVSGLWLKTMLWRTNKFIKNRRTKEQFLSMHQFVAPVDYEQQHLSMHETKIR